MAREPEKSARETGKAKTEATSTSKNAGNDEAGEAKPGASSTSDLLKTQHQELQAILAKRSDANADRDAIVKEFAAAWLPHIAVEQEILVPALNQAGLDEEKSSRPSPSKRDIINLLLANLLRANHWPPIFGVRWAAIATMKAVSSGAAGRTKVVAMAVGTAIRKAIRRRHAVVGRTAGASVRHATRSFRQRLPQPVAA